MRESVPLPVPLNPRWRSIASPSPNPQQTPVQIWAGACCFHKPVTRGGLSALNCFTEGLVALSRLSMLTWLARRDSSSRATVLFPESGKSQRWGGSGVEGSPATGGSAKRIGFQPIWGARQKTVRRRHTTRYPQTSRWHSATLDQTTVCSQLPLFSTFYLLFSHGVRTILIAEEGSSISWSNEGPVASSGRISTQAVGSGTKPVASRRIEAAKLFAV